MSDTQIICHCTNVSKKTIIEAIENGSINLESIQDKTTACTSCCSCAGDVENLIQQHAS